MAVKMINKNIGLYIFLCILSYFLGLDFEKEMVFKAKLAS